MKYEVLKVVNSSSNPNVTYEIRKSHQDGKTYCTCKGWIFKARKGDGICKHIAAYKAELAAAGRTEEVVVYTLEEFQQAMKVSRANTIVDESDNLKKNIRVKRPEII